MNNLLGLAAGGVLVAVTIALTVTVNVFEPPAPPAPTAEEIGHEVTRQYSQQVEASRQTAQERKNAMRCGLPGYGVCR